jgi:hypothetical protein
MKAVAELYEQDRHAWTLKNAELLRQGRWGEVDAEQVAEKLESMGRSERQELVNRLVVLLAHLEAVQKLPPPLRGRAGVGGCFSMT